MGFFFLTKQIFFLFFAISINHWEKISYFTNIHYICLTAVTRNLQVVILLHESLTILIHLPGFINCIVAEYCKDLTQIQTHLRVKALWWKWVNRHYEGCLVPTSGCSQCPGGLCAIPWGTAPTTLDTPRAGWGTKLFCPIGSSSGLYEGFWFAGCRCLSQDCNSLISGEVATNPFIKEMCVFHFKCSLGCREQASGSLFSH